MQATLVQVAPLTRSARDDVAHGQTVADRAMERYADGDPTAFGILYDELAPRLHRYALRQTRVRAAAEDVVQQAFLQIHRGRGQFARGAAVLTWAYAITRRLLIDAGRRRGREEHAGDGVPGPEARSGDLPADDVIERREQEQEARRDLERLPSALRESFQLVKLEGLSVAEAAEVLGITPGMVKIRTHRARKALQRALAEAEPLEGDTP